MFWWPAKTLYNPIWMNELVNCGTNHQLIFQITNQLFNLHEHKLIHMLNCLLFLCEAQVRLLQLYPASSQPRGVGRRNIWATWRYRPWQRGCWSRLPRPYRIITIPLTLLSDTQMLIFPCSRSLRLSGLLPRCPELRHQAKKLVVFYVRPRAEACWGHVPPSVLSTM